VTPASVFSTASQFDGAKSLAAEILAVSRGPEDFVLEEDEDGVDVTFECTGKEVCMHTSLYATKPGGKVIMVGMGTPVQTLPMSVAHLREVDILGIFRYANTYSTGIRLLCAQGKGAPGSTLPRLDDMVTHRFKGLDKAQNAFEIASRTSDNDGKLVLKVVIEA
jgi:L-iditol 2-dehydrogenase